MCVRDPLEDRWFVVHWEGYDAVFIDNFSQATLEPHDDIKHCIDAIEEYFARSGHDLLDDVRDPICVVSAETGEVKEKHLCVHCGELYARSQDLKRYLTVGCEHHRSCLLGRQACADAET